MPIKQHQGSAPLEQGDGPAEPTGVGATTRYERELRVWQSDHMADQVAKADAQNSLPDVHPETLESSPATEVAVAAVAGTECMPEPPAQWRSGHLLFTLEFRSDISWRLALLGCCGMRSASCQWPGGVCVKLRPHGLLRTHKLDHLGSKHSRQNSDKVSHIVLLSQ